jgi:stage II sporulation protein D
MSKRFVLLMLIVCAMSCADAGTNIRVGLTSSIGKPRALTVSCRSAFDVIGGGRVLAAAESGTAALSIDGSSIAVTVNDLAAGTVGGPVRLVPKTDGSGFEIVSPKAKYKRYCGILEVAGGPGLTVVNELPLEDYVRGVVPMEVPSGFHPEAQKALVLAIRTYALTSIGRHRASGFDVCDSTDCQGFCGASMDAQWADALIDATRGQIITYQGKPIHALYFSDCGGATQSNEDAGIGSKPWPYLRSVSDLAQQDDYCSGSPCHSWSKTFTPDELHRALAKSLKIGKLQSMEFSDCDSSSRVKTVRIKGDEKECTITGGKLRSLLGTEAVKSTRMTLSLSPEGNYIIAGKGWGHGVGLCSFGANGFAKAHPDKTYVDILKHYYTGVEVGRIQDQTSSSDSSITTGQ